MRALAWGVALALSLLASDAAAELAAQQTAAPEPASCRAPGNVPHNHWTLLARTIELADRGAAAPPLLSLEAGRYSAASSGSLRMQIARAGTSLKDDVPAWRQVYYIGAARTAEQVVRKGERFDPLGRLVRVPPDVARAAVFVTMVDRQDERTTLSVDMPENRSGWFGESWRIVVAACTFDHRMIGYGTIEVRVAPRNLSRALTFLALILLYAIAAYVAASENRAKLQHWWEASGLAPPGAAAAAGGSPFDAPRRQRIAWKALRASDPIFISQDALGCGSLGRLQLLVFSFAVIGVVIYVFLRSGEFVGLSQDILALLGITAGGSTLARAASLAPPLAAEDRRLLYGERIIHGQTPMPTIRDVLGGTGELDVTRLQAFAFSGFAVATLVINGVADLTTFKMPEQIISVLALSQGVYVAGKLIPSEAQARLRADLATLRAAARAVREAKAAGTPPPDIAFRQARSAAADSLEQVWAERFDRRRFEQLTEDEV